jgi:hypothetical protein
MSPARGVFRISHDSNRMPVATTKVPDRVTQAQSHVNQPSQICAAKIPAHVAATAACPIAVSPGRVHTRSARRTYDLWLLLVFLLALRDERPSVLDARRSLFHLGGDDARIGAPHGAIREADRADIDDGRYDMNVPIAACGITALPTWLQGGRSRRCSCRQQAVVSRASVHRTGHISALRAQKRGRPDCSRSAIHT